MSTNHRQVRAKDLCLLYQGWQSGTLDKPLLFDIGFQLAELCQAVPAFDQEDHDWGKDAGKFYWAWQNYLDRQWPSYLHYQSLEQYLFAEIDTLLAGCHTDTSVADYYIEGGTRLLDAVWSWDGQGSLYRWYLSDKAPIAIR